jgi:hypothetical protein
VVNEDNYAEAYDSGSWPSTSRAENPPGMDGLDLEPCELR